MSSNTYVLNRDYAASSRLGLQHYLWREILGFNLHPRISLEEIASRNGGKVRIAEIGAGTGLWAFDLARGTKSSSQGSDSRNGTSSHEVQIQVDAFDIDLSQFPPSPWIPENVKTHTWDILNEVSSEFVEQFDIVHGRLIWATVRNNDPSPVIENVSKLLKPGGFLQWDEVSSSETWIPTTSSNSNLPGLLDLKNLMVNAVDSESWKLALPSLLTKNGMYHDVTHEIHMTKEEYEDPAKRASLNLSLWKMYSDIVFQVIDEHLDHLYGVQKSRSDDCKERQVINRAAQESKEHGAYFIAPMVVCVARKV